MDFEKLYNAYFMEVYSFCFTILKNQNLAEEAAQETFYKAIKTKSSFKGKSKESTWLCAIAKNTCTDFLRKHKHTECIDDIEVADSSSSVAKVMDRVTALQIHTILHNLEEPYKEVFQLRVFGELAFSDIAKIFGKTENWARVTYHRAKIKIYERIEKNE